MMAHRPRLHSLRAPALALAFVLISSCSGGAGPVHVRVMTFNVLCSFCDPSHFDPWEERLAAFADIFARHQPDLVGTQEIFSAAEVEQVAGTLPGFASVYFHDPEGRRVVDYPDATIFYRKSMFELLDHGTYWLSDTPDEPWTYGWAQAQFWRVVTWARLRHVPTGRELYFATTHFDNNRPNQENSAPILLRYTEPQAKTRPAIVVGDFNSEIDTTAYATLTQGVDGKGFVLKDVYPLAGRRDVVHNQDAEPAYDGEKRYDHIFVTGPWQVPRWTVDLFVYGAQGRYPSDHFAVGADLVLP